VTEGTVVTLIGSSRVLEPEYLGRLDGGRFPAVFDITGSIWWCCRTEEGGGPAPLRLGRAEAGRHAGGADAKGEEVVLRVERTEDGWTLTEERPDERKGGGRTRRIPVPVPPVPVRRRRSA